MKPCNPVRQVVDTEDMWVRKLEELVHCETLQPCAAGGGHGGHVGAQAGGAGAARHHPAPAHPGQVRRRRGLVGRAKIAALLGVPARDKARARYDWQAAQPYLKRCCRFYAQ